MQEKALIEQLYSENECNIIRNFYNTDSTVRPLLKEAIGSKVITQQDKIIISNAIDAICLMCMTARFASSEDECCRVALTVYHYYNKVQNMNPSLAFDGGINLANNIFICLSFYPQSIEQRWKRRGAPSPAYYRKISKTIFSNHGFKDIASHHENWEAFFREVTV
jgi:hypothetical protein